MATAVFNKFYALPAYWANGAVNLGSDTIKWILTNVAPTATNSVYTDVSSNELANGNGYTTGGATATTISSSQTTGLYKLIISVAVPTWTATGSLPPFRYAIGYDSTAATKALLGWYDYGSTLSLIAPNTFTLTFDTTNGVIQNS